MINGFIEITPFLPSDIHPFTYIFRQFIFQIPYSHPIHIPYILFTHPLNILCFFSGICHCHLDNQEQARKQSNTYDANVLQPLFRIV